MRILFIFPLLLSFVFGQHPGVVEQSYTKTEYRIPMRDGATLFTAVYVPKDSSEKHPIMLMRTPYTVAPYGSGFVSDRDNNQWMAQERYILVYQDVRGRFLSEGEYEDVRPYIPHKQSEKDVDESSDAYDTIDWLIKNIRNNNGNVGMIGISYPGFYAAMGMIDAHPALKAVSPQAPIGDWYLGDDFHHNGALMLVDAFNFFSSFGKPRPALTTQWPPSFKYPTPDGYRFLLEAGSLASLKQQVYGDTAKFWNDVFAHPDYDRFWKERNVSQHLKKITPAVLLVGGWFDAEDLSGPLSMYSAIEANDKHNKTSLMMGPWFHGGWVRSAGNRLGNVSFGVKSSEYYGERIRTFFNYYLKGEGSPNVPEVSVFETGTNQWRTYESWPPKNIVLRNLYFYSDGKLSFARPVGQTGFDDYVSDPHRPVPYTNDITNDRSREYMTEDQRFAWQRPDVLSYETDVLSDDITVAGPVKVNLYASTTGTDADFVVKIIDVFPDSVKDDPSNAPNVRMGGYQMLVRGDVMRARYRKSFEHPVAMQPNKIEKIPFSLNDINHTFRKGHRIMVQVQSSWFPLVDRNPQQFVNIYRAKEADFIKTVHAIYRDTLHPSSIEIGQINR